MCGIAGLIGAGQGELEALDRALAHRGPDDRGFLGWSPGGALAATRDPAQAAGALVALVHRRLSILDLGEGGWQPMVSADGQAAIVFNGEVYNFIELRGELEALGHRFHGRSDTEVVLAAWRQWGTEAFRRFVGMFALAVFEPARRRLVLARDPFGIKPLYWTMRPQGFAFASEIPALLTLPGVAREVDPQSLYEYLRFGLSDRGARTMLAHIRRLPAGHWMEVPLDGAPDGPRAFWTLRPDTLDIGMDEAAAHLRRLFENSVRLHLRSDVPVAMALSGGIDSSAILATARAADPGAEMHAFSFVSEDPAQSEEAWIDRMGQAAGVRVHKIHPQAGDLGRELDRLVAAQGEPFATTSIFAQDRVFAAVGAAGIKVSLDGQGADEMLAGYPTYRAARLAGMLMRGDPAALRLARAGGLGSLIRAGGLLLPPGLSGLARRLAGEPEVPAWLDGDWFRERGVSLEAPGLPRRRDLLHDRLEQTLADLSLPSLLRYADRNSMAHSVESRVPFLTPALAEFILALPVHLLLADDGTTKAVFRRAMREVVPDSILDRRDKIGFSTPERRWLAGLGADAEAMIGEAAGLPVLRGKAARAEWHGALAGKGRWDSRFWRWINLTKWCKGLGCRL